MASFLWSGLPRAAERDLFMLCAVALRLGSLGELAGLRDFGVSVGVLTGLSEDGVPEGLFFCLCVVVNFSPVAEDDLDVGLPYEEDETTNSTIQQTPPNISLFGPPCLMLFDKI